MKDDFPIQDNDFYILSKAINECIWITTLMCMPWHKRFYWKIRGMDAFIKNRK